MSAPSQDIKQEPVVLLCGGQGTRLREETEWRPKALVEIGGRPILWHLMRHYYHFGYRRFILCLGYRGNMIKEYFLNYRAMSHDFTLKFSRGRDPELTALGGDSEEWEITCVDTGPETQSGGRLNRVKDLIDTDRFLANYSDGLSDVDLDQLVGFHEAHGKIATVTGFHPHSKYGIVRADDAGTVYQWQEKPLMNDLTSGGFFVFDKRLFDYLDDDATLEIEPFQRIAADKEMALYRHDGFWQCMDTFKEAQAMKAVWNQGQAPWKIWL